MMNFSASYAGNSVSTADRNYAQKVLHSPLVQRLSAAGLASFNLSDICRLVQEWRCVGGSFSDVLAQRAKIPLQTIHFFSQNNPTPTSGRRIGDYLVAAGLVTQLTIRQTLEELLNKGQRQLLGQALADRHHISHRTANYFAETYTTPQPTNSVSVSEFDSCLTMSRPTRRRSLNDFCKAAADALAYSRNVGPKMREEAAEMLAIYPNHSKVKYWCARMGVSSK
ncbi:MAG: hypothetical protein AAF268_09935 [Cyanobacteria bacterium P01_A01_bin.3]